jgi:hypothetical protein
VQPGAGLYGYEKALKPAGAAEQENETLAAGFARIILNPYNSKMETAAVKALLGLSPFTWHRPVVCRTF